MKRSLPILLLLFVVACESYSKYPISEAQADTYNAMLIGKWKLEEDTNKNNYYLVQNDKDIRSHKYHVRFFDRGGTNPTYESGIYLSKVGEGLFVNIPYWMRHADKYPDEQEDYYQTHGYFFLRILDTNKGFTRLTAATVHDDKLADLESSKEVYARIQKHLNDAAFYPDTVHLYKVQ